MTVRVQSVFHPWLNCLVPLWLTGSTYFRSDLATFFARATHGRSCFR